MMEVSPMRMLSSIITSLKLWGFLDYQNKVKIGAVGFWCTSKLQNAWLGVAKRGGATFRMNFQAQEVPESEMLTL